MFLFFLPLYLNFKAMPSDIQNQLIAVTLNSSWPQLVFRPFYNGTDYLKMFSIHTEQIEHISKLIEALIKT